MRKKASASMQGRSTKASKGSVSYGYPLLVAFTMGFSFVSAIVMSILFATGKLTRGEFLTFLLPSVLGTLAALWGGMCMRQGGCFRTSMGVVLSALVGVVLLLVMALLGKELTLS